MGKGKPSEPGEGVEKVTAGQPGGKPPATPEGQPSAAGGKHTAEQTVRLWLSEQGFPLEMRCARVFHDAGAGVVQGAFYPTPEGKSREIDLVARFRDMWHVPPATAKGNPSLVFSDLRVVVECKSGPVSQKPWVVFSSTRNTMDVDIPYQRLGSEIGQQFLTNEVAVDEFKKLAVFQVPERHGYGLRCAFNDKHDQAYAALTSLVSAAKYIAGGGDEVVGRVSRIVLPVLVVDTPIFECWLDDDGKMQLEPCERATLVWRNATTVESHVIIEIIHEDALPAYAAEVMTAAVMLQEPVHRTAMTKAVAEIEKLEANAREREAVSHQLAVATKGLIGRLRR